MIKLTIWRRLNTPLAFLTLLLLIGAALAWWVEKSRLQADRRSDDLIASTARVRLELVQMSDSLRGLLLDSKSDADRKSNASAEKDLGGVLMEMERKYGSHSELTNSLNNLLDYVTKTLDPYQAKL